MYSVLYKTKSEGEKHKHLVVSYLSQWQAGPLFISVKLLVLPKLV